MKLTALRSDLLSPLRQAKAKENVDGVGDGIDQINDCNFWKFNVISTELMSLKVITHVLFSLKSRRGFMFRAWFNKKFKRWMVCAYCGEKLAWRWAWDKEITWVYYNTSFHPMPGLWDINWRRVFPEDKLCCNVRPI